jgi:hypothetical protein
VTDLHIRRKPPPSTGATAAEVCEYVLSRPSTVRLARLQRALAKDLGDTVAADAVRALLGDEEVLQRYPALPAVSFLADRYDERPGTDTEIVVFWPEDFAYFFIDLAYAVGLDVERLGRRLDPDTTNPETTVGLAFARLCEIEGVYVEVPGALTTSRVSRAFLAAVTSAMIGIASARATSYDTAWGGAIGGIGGLLINIIATRYVREDEPT